jgi:hypothetical protein
VDRKAGTVATRDGALVWEFERGLVRLAAPRAQGITGFLAGAGRVELPDVVIESANEYGSVLVVSLDGEPIARSRRLLIQAVTEDRPSGFRAEGGRILDLGSGPMLVRDVAATVVLRGRSRLRTVRVVAPSLAERGRIEPEIRGRDLRVALPRDASYVVVE